MKQGFLLFIISLVVNLDLLSQEYPYFVQENIAYCESNVSDKQAIQLREELKELEDYFVKKGLLKDKSGSSYIEVLKQIAMDNDLYFNIDRDFQILDKLGFKIYSKCYYKALDPEGFGKLTDRHLHAAEVIVQNNNDEITPGIVAQRILDNLLDEDFDLEFYKISSLIAFYTISQTGSIMDFVEANKSLADFSEIMEVFLDDTNRITIDGSYVSFDQLKQKAHQFLQIDPNEKGIVLIASKEVSYEVYLQVKEILSLVYSELNVEDGDVSKNIIYKFEGL
ncbi:hypothetical protein MM236_13970 [Belliella sp. DSM 107340]|uniref:Uncharacterized protein n=1 Tax=Belliella calami TaxID=2923436 RepID=A0ABS9UR69_9BACT|nr:biopolymer transporter ExbD [Belliella calami]MCH7399107.1 hypothetical protein [Belliella calami]